MEKLTSRIKILEDNLIKPPDPPMVHQETDATVEETQVSSERRSLRIASATFSQTKKRAHNKSSDEEETAVVRKKRDDRRSVDLMETSNESSGNSDEFDSAEEESKETKTPKKTRKNKRNRDKEQKKTIKGREINNDPITSVQQPENNTEQINEANNTIKENKNKKIEINKELEKMAESNLQMVHHVRQFLLRSKEQIAVRDSILESLYVLEKNVLRSNTIARECINGTFLEENTKQSNGEITKELIKIKKAVTANQRPALKIRPPPQIEETNAQQQTKQHPTRDYLAAAMNPATQRISEPVTKKYKIIVYPKEGNTAKTSIETRAQLTSIPLDVLKIKPDRLINVRNNGVMIESSSLTLRNLLRNPNLENLKLEAKEQTETWPSIFIHNVEKNTTKEQLTEELQKTHAEKFRNLEGSWLRNLNPVHSKNRPTTNWIANLHPDVAKSVIAEGKIRLQWRSYYVSDYINITRCYQCQRFGHPSKYCRSAQACQYCSSSEHKSSDCPDQNNEDRRCCINCTRAKYSCTNHAASSNACRIYKEKLQEIVNQTSSSIIYG